MRRILKWIGILLLVLLGAGIAAYVAMLYTVKQKLNTVYEIPHESIEFRSDTETIARGAYLYHIIGLCKECHGEDLSGSVYEGDFLTGDFTTPNLTGGKGGLAADMTDDDLARAIRHGIGKDGKTLVGMLSNYFYNFSDRDLAALIAYIRSVPAVDNELPPTKFGPMIYLYILQDPSALPAQVIDHTGKRPPAPEPGITIEYGRYLGLVCRSCHGENMAGGTQPGAGLNLTPGGDLGSWSEEDFLTTMSTGVTPSGRQLDPELMAWETLSKMTDEDLKAIWLYLQSLPPVQNPTPTPE